MAHGERASAESLAAFIAAHPEFATGVTIGGSKKNKLYGPKGEFLADVIQGTSGANPTWAWDDSTADGGGNALDPSYLAPWDQQFNPGVQMPGEFNYQDFGGWGDFKAPTAESMLQDPSYQFRRDEMTGAMQNRASAGGLLGSSGTIKDMLDQVGKYASLEYGNIWNRDFGAWNQAGQNKLATYGANRGNAADAWTKNYGRATSLYDQSWQQFLDRKNTWYANQNNPFDKLSRLAGIGAGATQ